MQCNKIKFKSWCILYQSSEALTITLNGDIVRKPAQIKSKAQLLLWTLLLVPTYSNTIKGHFPVTGIISSFLEQFIKPYIGNFNYGSRRATVEETKIEKAIRLKIEALRPMLQDTDENKPKTETENNLTLEGNDETTIIEFLPKVNVRKNKNGLASRELKSETDSFKKSINKYKHLKKTIKKALDKENTHPSTKKLITRTLDEMIAKLVESQCTWKDSKHIKRHLLKINNSTRLSMQKLNELSKDSMPQRKTFKNLFKYTDYQIDELMKDFHNFFTNVLDDTSKLSKRYTVRCQLVEVGNDNTPESYLREDKLKVEKKECEVFKICSDELKDFLTNFYSSLNDTAVSTLTNYAAMYVRDVNADVGLDKDIVVSVLDNLRSSTERKVSKIFRKELDKFTLDKNKNKRANIQHINDFVTATWNHIKTVLNKNLRHELGAMRTKLFATVKDDLIVNLKADLNHMERLLVDRICSLFVSCNSKNIGRRFGEPGKFVPKRTENVYVKVQLTLDDELKESISGVQQLRNSWQGQDMTHRVAKSMGIDRRKYSNINVTRTTYDTTTGPLRTDSPLVTSKAKLHTDLYTDTQEAIF